VIGEVIGNYRVVSELGRGGMGLVYRAEHVQLGRPAALKMLLSTFSGDASFVQRFFNEARAASSIDHPGIVEVFDFGTHTDGRAYIVMELLKGHSLDARLKQGVMTPEEGATLVAQAVAALAAAHARGIVHRDLKPDNIFLVPNELIPGGIQVKLLDFGIAKLANDQAAGFKTQTGALIGTPAYMSPEQCMGRADLDHRTDIYAIGCILFHTLCGRPPFVGDQGTGMMIAAHIRDTAPDPRTFNPQVPAGLAAIIRRCLEKEPGERFQTATELRQALVAAGANTPLSKPGTEAYKATLEVGGAPTMASGVHPAPTTTSGSAGQIDTPAATSTRARRSRVWIGVGCALVALAGVGVVVAIQGDPREASPTGVLPRPLVAAIPPVPRAAVQPASGHAPASLGDERVPPLVNCPAGQDRSPDTRGHCCWPAQAWSSATNRCVGPPSCPPGTIAHADQCTVHHAVTPDKPILTVTPTGTAPAMRLNAASYASGTTIEIHFAAAIRSTPQSRAWVTVAQAGTPASSYGVWSYVEDGAESITLKAPDAAGAYELRLHTDYPKQSFNVRQMVPFTITAATAVAVTPLGEQRFSLAASAVQPGAPLELRFSAALHAAPGERFWIAVTPLDAPDTASGSWKYVPDAARRAQLVAPSEPGDYEVRLHANYPTKATNVVDRVTVRVEPRSLTHGARR
jgi:hypothetical protein